MLVPGGNVEHGLGKRQPAVGCSIDQQFADGLGRFGAARLARGLDIQALCAEPFGQACDLGGLATPSPPSNVMKGAARSSRLRRRTPDEMTENRRGATEGAGAGDIGAGDQRHGNRLDAWRRDREVAELGACRDRRWDGVS